MSEGADHEANQEGEIPDEMTEELGAVGDAEEPAEDMLGLM